MALAIFEMMLSAYLATCAATFFIIGFEIDGIVYVVTLPTLPRWLVKQSKTSKGALRIALNITKGSIAKLLEAGAKPVGTVADVMGDMINGNRGDGFERYIYRVNGQEWQGHNSAPYYESGDIVINGVHYQIKYMLATVTTFDNIEKAKAAAGA